MQRITIDLIVDCVRICVMKKITHMGARLRVYCCNELQIVMRQGLERTPKDAGREREAWTSAFRQSPNLIE
jgi:hypothetical protein